MTAARPDLAELRELLDAAPDGPPWIRNWESLDVHGMHGDGVLTDQRNIDLAVAAVNALPALLSEIERRGDDLGAAVAKIEMLPVYHDKRIAYPNLIDRGVVLEILAAVLTEGSR